MGRGDLGMLALVEVITTANGVRGHNVKFCQVPYAERHLFFDAHSSCVSQDDLKTEAYQGLESSVPGKRQVTSISMHQGQYYSTSTFLSKAVVILILLQTSEGRVGARTRKDAWN